MFLKLYQLDKIQDDKVNHILNKFELTDRGKISKSLDRPQMMYLRLEKR